MTAASKPAVGMVNLVVMQ
uniref:Uncharacterized protein n=1 Tax=Arundo donax TaxID=35708 RepID=A0A0A9E0T9_ARUDO